MTGDRNGNGDGTARDGGRSLRIDSMRAAAIVAVVIIHVFGPSMEVTPERGPAQAAFFALFVLGSGWAVPCFFFLSGLLLTRRAELPTWSERLTWLRRRGVRLLPPYLFWSALCLIAAKQADPIAILRSLAAGTASYQMYFVVALVQAYVLWWLVMPWLSRQTARVQTVLLLATVAVTVVAHVWRAAYLSAVETDQFAWLRATVLPWIGYFGVGCLVAVRGRKGKKGDTILFARDVCAHSVVSPFLPSALVALTVLVLMATGEATYHGPHRDDPLNTLLKPVYAFPMILVAAWVGGWFERRAGERAKRFATALARDSYGIYLSHVLVMRLLEGHIYLQLAGLSLPMELAYRVFALVVTIGVAWGIVRALSLVPGVRWMAGAELA